jgi:hypothetical protein
MTPETCRGINNSVEFIRLCIKLEIIKELYYDARPNKSQDEYYSRVLAYILTRSKQ